ncbi:MAG: hypothetical protein IT380_16315 [Myxococcales bacterium]|nr:hypothetical protein [Myxococcales bacterium]
MDVLLHEMMHQSIDQHADERDVDTGGTSSHNCAAWVAEVNRLSPLLGLKRKTEVIRQRRVNGRVTWAAREEGSLTMRELATWPYCLRPDGYYRARAKGPAKAKQKRSGK